MCVKKLLRWSNHWQTFPKCLSPGVWFTALSRKLCFSVCDVSWWVRMEVPTNIMCIHVWLSVERRIHVHLRPQNCVSCLRPCHTKLVLTMFLSNGLRMGWRPENFEQVRSSGRPIPSMKFVVRPWSSYYIHSICTQFEPIWENVVRTYFGVNGVLKRIANLPFVTGKRKTILC